MPRWVGLFFVPFLGFSLKVDTFLKKEHSFFHIFNDNGNFLEDLNPTAENNLPGFEHFEVKKKGDSLVLEWKGDKTVKSCLIITATGKVIRVHQKKVILKKSEVGDLITVYPVAGKDKLGLPSVVQLDG
jgi:hypothetical protein